MKFLDKLRSWAPWILAVIALAFMVRNEFRHRAALKSALEQIQVLQGARAKAADLQLEKDIDAAEQSARTWVEDESNRTDLGTYLRDELRRASDGAIKPEALTEP